MAEFTIEFEQKLQCNLHGEPISKKRLRFSIRPRHLRVAYRFEHHGKRTFVAGDLWDLVVHRCAQAGT